MIEKLQKAKHWHLFLLLFGLPFVVYIGWMISVFTNIINDASYESYEYPSFIFDGIAYVMMLMLIPITVLYAWYWSMGVGLQNKLPEGMKMKVNRFKVFFIIPIVYLLAYFLLIIVLFENIEIIENLENLENLDDFDNVGMFLFGFMFFMFLSLFVTFCTFYQYWFIAKTIKSAELQREALFSEFVGEFFLLWFYPIGVWILQPMVNKLVEEEKALEA